MGSGDELLLIFEAAALPALPAGWSRQAQRCQALLRRGRQHRPDRWSGRRAFRVDPKPVAGLPHAAALKQRLDRLEQLGIGTRHEEIPNPAPTHRRGDIGLRVEDRALYLALPEATMEGIFADKIADVLFDDKLVVTVTFDPDEEVIVRWIP